MKRVFSCVVAASLALSLLAGCGASSTASSAASGAASSEAASSVASSAVETAALPDGVYTADFDTDSSMFHANEACNGKGTLTVENGQMTFHVSLASTHIVNLYLGKAADAAANASDWLQPTTDTVTYSDGTSEEVYGFDSRSLPWMPTLIWLFWAPRASGTIMSSACAMRSNRLAPQLPPTAPTPAM